MSKLVSAAAVVGIAAGLAACGAHLGASGRAGDVRITDVVAWGFPGSGTLTIGCHLKSSAGDSLTAVTTSAAAHASLHNVVTTSGVSQMVEVPAVPLPAGSTVVLGTGGYHVMLDSLTGTFMPGDSVSVALVFARGGRLELRVPVVKFGDAQDLLNQ